MSLGKAYVEAAIDTTGFSDELEAAVRAAIAALSPEARTIEFLADTKKVTAKLDKLRADLASITDKVVNVRVNTTGDDGARSISAEPLREQLRDSLFEVAIIGNLTALRTQLAALNDKAKPTFITFAPDLSKVYTELAKIEAIEVPVTAKVNRQEFRNDANRQVEGAVPIRLPVLPDTSGFRAAVQAVLTDPFDVKLDASTAALRTKIEAAFNRARPVRISTDVANDDLGRTGTAGQLELSDAADKATASIRRQIAALREAGASESDVLSLLRRQLDELAARARALNIDVPVRIDSSELAAELERAVEAADRAGRAVSIPVVADLTALRAQLASLNGSTADKKPIEVNFVANTEVLRAQLESISTIIEIPVFADTKVIRTQLANLSASDAIVVPVRADLSFLRFQLQSLTIAEAIDVPVRADLTFLRTQLTSLTAARAIQVPVVADLTLLRAQLATLGSVDSIKVPLSATVSSIAELRARIETFLRATPILVDITARLEPGNLKELRTQAGRLAAVNVKATIDQDAFRNQLIAAGREGIRVKIIASDIVKFRNEIRDFFKRLPALVEIRPADIVAFRGAIQAAMRQVPARVNVVPGNVQGFRDELRAALAATGAFNISLKVANAATFRQEVRAILALETFPINIRPVVDPAVARRAGAAAGDAAGKGLAERLNKAFSFAFGSLGRNFRQLERGFVQLAAVGEASFLAIGAAGLFFASKVELLNTSLQNLAESTQAAFEAGDIGLDDTLLGENVKTIEELTDKVGELQKRIVDFAKASPLGVDAVSDAVIRLTSSLDVTGDQALAQIKAISGALAITPEGLNAEGLKGVVKALTQIASAGKLGGQELLQLSNQIPVLARTEIFTNLAKQIVGAKDAIKGVTAETKTLTNEQLQQAKKLQKAGRFDSNQALRAILESLQATPGAEKALERFNETLTGTIQRVKETLQFDLATLFLGEDGKGLQEFSKGIEDATDDLIESLRDSGFVEAFRDQFAEAVKIFIAAIPPVLRAITQIGEAFTAAFSAIGPEGFAAIGEVIGTVFAKAGEIVVSFIETLKSVREFLIGTSDPAQKIQDIFQSLRDTLSNLGPIISAVAQGFGLVAVALLPLANVAAIALEAFSAFAASDFGKPFVVLAAAIAATAAATLLLRTRMIALIATQGVLAASTLIATGRFIAQSFAVSGLAGALAALRISAAVSAAGMIAALGPVGVVIAGIVAGAVAFEAGRRGVLALGRAFGIGEDPAKRFEATLNGVTVQASSTQGVIDKLREKLGDLPTDVSIEIKDNISDTITRFSQLTAAAQTAAQAMRQLGYTVDQVSKASIEEFMELQRQQDATRGKLIGPFVGETEGKKRPDAAPVFPDLNLDKFGIDASKGFEDATSKAKTAAETAAEKFADAIKKLVLDIDRNIRQQLIEGSAEKVKETLNDLRDKIIDVFKEAGKDVPSGLLRRIRLDNATLQRLARERDRILEEIKAAEAKFSQTRDAALAFGGISNAIDAATSSVAKAGKTLKSTLEATTLDVAGSFQVIRKRTNEAIADQQTTDRVAVTTRNLLAAFKDRLKVLRDFNADIKKLAERGLDKQIIDDLITAGPEASAETADVLANASKKTLSEFNKVQGQLEDQAAKLGATATNSLFRQGEDFATGVLATLRTSRDATKAAITKLVDGLLTDVKSALVQGKAVDVGVDIVRGIVKGLKSRAPAVRNEIRDLIDDLVAEVKDRLQIKSPSRVFAGIGADTVQGLANGLSNSGVVKSAAAGLAGAVSSLDMSIPELSTLLNLSTTEAEAALARLQLPNLDASVLSKMPQSTKVDVDHLVRQREESAAARQQQIDYARLEGVMRMARSQTVYQQPITQHFQHPVTPQQAAVDVTRIRVGR